MTMVRTITTTEAGSENSDFGISSMSFIILIHGVSEIWHASRPRPHHDRPILFPLVRMIRWRIRKSVDPSEFAPVYFCGELRRGRNCRNGCGDRESEGFFCHPCVCFLVAGIAGFRGS